MLWMMPSAATRVAVLSCSLAAWFGLSVQRAASRRAAEVRLRVEVAEIVRTVAGELRAGVSPLTALRTACADASPPWQPLGAADASDVPGVMRMLAQRAGGSGLLDVATAWEIADQSGAPLSGVMERVADAVQTRVDIDREVALEASPARATAKLMAVLPVFGLALGALLGAHPLRVLLGTWPGVACLSIGLTLSCVGVWWIERIVTAVEKR
jgi:tight adherence protein B